MYCAKMIICCLVIWCVMIAPCWFAGLNKKPQAEALNVRIASLAFGWTCVGWLWAMWVATRPAKSE